jgi:hypothetical protein
MKLLGFGKKKDDHVEEFIIRKDLDKRREGDEEIDTSIIEEHKDIMDDNTDKNIDEIEENDENNSDYIDLDDLSYDEYEEIVGAIEGFGWHLVSDIAFPITNLDTQIVSQKTDSLEIVCPPERKIVICGLNEGGADMDNFYNGPNIYQTPHFITLMCTDINGVALPQTTLISILKYTKDGEIEMRYQEFYGDLSPVVDGKLKRKEERYYFTETIILQEGERLIFNIHNPGTIVSKIDLLILSDFFEKDEE